jgi:hypothetical protein
VVDALLVQGKVNAEAERKPIRSCSERPRRSTDHAMTISNWRRLASLCRASKQGRLSRHLGPRIRGTHVFAARECRSFSVGADWRAGLERAILFGMAYEYRVTEAADGTFPVELWSSKGGREQLVYKTRGFQTRELAEAWTVPVEVQSGDPPQPRARVTYLKPRRSRVVIISKPNPLPPLASPPALPDS